MKKTILFTFLILAGYLQASAQSERITIVFKDKKNSPFSLNKPWAYLSPKAILRRQRQGITIKETDLPVNPAYTDSIRQIPGVKIIVVSKWLNEVLAEVSDPAAFGRINGFPFVISTEKITPSARINAYTQTKKEEFNLNSGSVSGFDTAHFTTHSSGAADELRYGKTYPQIHIHQGEYLHNLGYLGEGMTIAVLDAGFLGYKTNTSLDSARAGNQVLGEFDFVMNEPSVNEDNVHGFNCLSIIAANKPDTMVGSAPKANFYLYRTEDTRSETPVEEHYWALAAERADSIGADMISSSLGYTIFDNPAESLIYAKRDGHTAVSTRAANMAAGKGMIVMCSAGNSGVQSTDNKFVNCPADGDSVMAVGAVDTSKIIATFSSWGPNSSGKIKPNVVSMGRNAVYSSQAGNPATGSGTSYSNPNLAGLVACLWQAFRDFNNWEIMDAVQKSSDRYNQPDERFGYGIPDFHVAYDILQAKRKGRLDDALKTNWIKVFPVPITASFTVLLKAPVSATASFQLTDVAGHIIQTRTMLVQKDNYYNINFTPPVITAGIYFLQYLDGENKVTLKLAKQ